MGDAFISLLGGLTGTLEERRRRNEDQARVDVEQQQSIFRWLLENPDPEIKAIGLAGILEPPKKTLFGHLKGSSAYEEARALAERMGESGPGIPSPPAPIAQPGAAGMPDVPPLTGGGGATGPAAPSGAGGVPPIDWPAGVPAVGGGPSPTAPPPAAPAAPSTGPPPTAPLELAAGTVPQGPAPGQQRPSSPEQAEQQVRGFLQGVTPEEALESMEKADPDQMQEGLRPLRVQLQKAVLTGATMEQVLSQTFQVAAKEEGRLTREELKAETKLAVAQARSSDRAAETLLKLDARWDLDRAKGREAMERLDKALGARERLATGTAGGLSKLEQGKLLTHVYAMRKEQAGVFADFGPIEEGLGKLKEHISRYANSSGYAQQKAYNDYASTVSSLLGTVAASSGEGKRISDQDAKRFEGKLKPSLVSSPWLPDAWARFDPQFAAERLDDAWDQFSSLRDSKVNAFQAEIERGPGTAPPTPPPEPEGLGPGMGLLTPGEGAVTVETQAEVDALPNGTTFIWTDGKQYVKD